ncbi:right-handed parallel beta-helix repeat-containing protein [Thermovibrio sp.]
MKRVLITLLGLTTFFQPAFGKGDNLYFKFGKKELIKVPKSFLKEKIVPHRPKRIREEVPSFKEIKKRFSPESLIPPKTSQDFKVEVEPVQRLYVLPFEDYYLKWKFRKVKVIVISKGTASIEGLYRKLKGTGLIRKEGRSYILKAPLFIGPKGGLVVEGVKLKLAFEPGAPIMCAGKLWIKNSLVETWDDKKKKYYPIGKIKYEDYFLYGKQPPRPFITAIKGGRLFIISSKIRGLGYRGLFASFGLSITGWPVIENLFSIKGLKLKPLLAELRESKGIFVGNTIKDNYMGIYSNEAKELVILGNHLKGNYQYNIDPHDWSKNIIIGFNIIEGARKAHGVVFSRYVKGKIFNNIIFNNNGAGIMMDRRSRALMKENLVFRNNIGGISLLESDNQVILGNTILQNGSYGIYVRNSLNAFIKGNTIVDNGGNGVETSVINISFLSYRNLYIDPYHLASSSWLESNTFNRNFSGCAKSIYGGVAFYKNELPQYPLFKGDLADFSEEIVSQQEIKPVVIPGLGNTELIMKRKKDVFPALIGFFNKQKRENWNDLQTALGIAQLIEGERLKEKGLKFKGEKLKSEGIEKVLKAAYLGNSKALYYLGVIYPTIEENFSKASKESEILIGEAALLNNQDAQYATYLLKTIKGISREKVNRILSRALQRLLNGKLTECSSPHRANLNLIYILSLKERFNNDLYSFIERKIDTIANIGYLAKLNRLKRRVRDKNKRFYKFFSWEKEFIRKYKTITDEFPNLTLFITKEKELEKLNRKWYLLYFKEDFSILQKEAREILIKYNQLQGKGRKINIENEIKRYKDVISH